MLPAASAASICAIRAGWVAKRTVSSCRRTYSPLAFQSAIWLEVSAWALR